MEPLSLSFAGSGNSSAHTRYYIEDRSYLSIIKKEVAREAETLGFAPEQMGRLDIIIAELASNLIKFGQRKRELLWKPFNHPGVAGIEIIALDAGPGISNTSLALQDGYSTSGTAGEGLGAIKRLSDTFELYSQAGGGTIVLSRLFAKEVPVWYEQLTVAGISVAKPNEQRCGDGYHIDYQPGKQLFQLLVLDGLGHGPEAYRAAQEGIAAYKQAGKKNQAEKLFYLHEHMKKTRGAVAMALQYNFPEKSLQYCGVGNIAGRIIKPDTVKALTSYNGIVGHVYSPRNHNQDIAWEKGQLLVVCSDGITSRWDLTKYPQIQKYDPTIIAACLYRDFNRGTDDVTVVVSKHPDSNGKKVQEPLLEVVLDRELDLVVAYKHAMQLAEISGLNFTDQTKFATAVSEISRNALQYATKGITSFYVSKISNRYYVEAVVSDQGPGIKQVEKLLENLTPLLQGHRSGIYNCKRLSDNFSIESSSPAGTCIRIGKRLPATHPPITPGVLAGWREHLKKLAPISPYDELKRQNHLLLATLEELRQSKTQTQDQLEEIQSLNEELELKNAKLMQLSRDYVLQNELLKKRNQELDEFAHIVSHDLKGPLRNISGLVQLMEAGISKSPQEINNIFKGQLQKMEILIENILTYSRSGHEEMEKTEVDLDKLLHELVEGISRPAGFTFRIQPNFPKLYTEEIFAFQVYSNLLHNAVKYNNKGAGGIVQIGYERTPEGSVIFFVEDNGLGIPVEKREKAFKIFTVLHKIKGIDSTGIGLAIVKKIIQYEGGEIWIEDAREFTEGCRFCFTWPRESGVFQP